MTVRERILTAARQLAAERPVDSISLADVARAADVSWPTVRRHIGGKTHLKEFLASERLATTPPDRDTRGRILSAAARVFARNGYDGATLDQVAATAGLTKGAVYWHFASKSDLFLALLEENTRQQSSDLPAALQEFSRIADPVERLTAILTDQFATCLEDQDWPRLYLEFSASSRDPQVRERLHELHRSFHAIVSDVIRQAQVEGSLAPDLDPYAVAVMFSSLLRGLSLTWLVSAEHLDAEDLIPKLARILWQGLGTSRS